ncbi:hypothetical protein [Longimicrobium terrae]|uniref:Uncharacterized protein n=1 Tax=Longimicrobium terrae TaxID=1639882 RepID=A0A841H3Q7_9BACT|nr:hypothetical protein [Longimicrobium terrae]MBB4638077.1 hypothetical protein [Longimicrobium terrae]MBB6072449.1 hypothetical protein [Longimicrobium terrae]NNC32137.1 hypothetical protein [Longimicrobium terrae]
MAAAQAGWSAEARYRLAESLTYHGRGGMWAAGAPRTATLGEDGAAEYRVRLVPGRRYAIHGVCGERCSDIDLRLFDPGGRELVRDVEAGPDPLIEVRAGIPGVYRVRLVMVRCAGAACNTALGVFSAAD